MKGGIMKYLIFGFLLTALLITAGCTTGNQVNKSSNGVLNTTASVTDITPIPVTTVEEVKIIQDPIVGSWLNGMECDANGNVKFITTKYGGSWKHIDDSSYWVIDDNNYAVEWIYNKNTDCLKERKSSQIVCRGVMVVPTYTQSTNSDCDKCYRLNDMSSLSCLYECNNPKPSSIKDNGVSSSPTLNPSYIKYYQPTSPSSPSSPTIQPTSPSSPTIQPTSPSVTPVYTLPPATPTPGREYITPNPTPDIVMKPR